MDMRSLINIVREAWIEEGRFLKDQPVPAAAPAAPAASPRAQGWECASNGGNSTDNPFQTGSTEAHEWEVGYQNYFFND